MTIREAETNPSLSFNFSQASPARWPTMSELYFSFPTTVWTARLAFTMQTVAVPLALSFKPLCVVVALCWLVYRASLVLQKPLDELASLLGFEIPPTPTIDLACIKADGAIVHWTLPEKPKQRSALKYEIHLNGTLIDTLSVHESAVTISGLQPASFYVVRIALVHNLEFGSKSEPLRFRTKPSASGDFFLVSDGHETDHEGHHDPVPRTRPYRGLKDVALASAVTSSASRESTGLVPKRLSGGRKLSSSTAAATDTAATTTAAAAAAFAGTDSKQYGQPDEPETVEGAGTVQYLTEKLDALRRETDEAEKVAKEEEEEELRQKEELTRERDELKTEVTEKERASRNLKREVNTLERQNTAAQNERSKQERVLAQKKLERQKLKADLVRWDREAAEMKAEAENIAERKSEYLSHVTKEKEDLRRRQTEDSENLQTLDNEVKEKTAEVKKLERSLKNNSPNGTEPEPSLVQQYQQDAEEERAWQVRRQALQQQYTNAFHKMENAKRFHLEQMRYLESLRAERGRAEDMARYSSPPPTHERVPRRGDSQRSHHATARHSVSDSSRPSSFVLNQSPFNSIGNMPSGSFSAAGSAPFLNLQNGMTIAGPTNDMTMSEEDREKLTGGAMMSPGAGAELIPADLFSGEVDNKLDRVQPLAGLGQQPLPGLGSLPGLPGLPGSQQLPHSQPLQDSSGYGPASPVSASSRSPSVFASPQASSHNLHGGSPEGVMDADRRSVTSNRSNRAASGGGTVSRFSGIFGIKQRAKTTPEDSLTLSKSTSMPRQDQRASGIDNASRKRNSSISGAMVGDATGIDDSPDVTAEVATSPPSRKHFGIFSREKSGGWPSTFTSLGRRPVSPRPGSTHSNELPRPSVDGSRWGVETWPSSDAASAASRGSPLAFGSGWNVPGQPPRMYGSRHASRRPSAQYGATGPPEDIIEDEDADSDVLDPGQETHLAPIGTMPSPDAKTQAASPARLDPNAKDFKSFFSSIKLTKSKEGPATPTEKGFPSVTSATQTPVVGGYEKIGNDESPPDSRKSRDNRSLNTNESSLAESNRNSADLTRTTSYNNSDAPLAPSPSMRSGESFMQKITRKSSSGKFSLPTFRQREKSRLDPSVAGGSNSSVGSTPVPPAEDEEDSLSASAGSVKDGAMGSPNLNNSSSSNRSDRGGDTGRDSKETNRSTGRSWSSVLKLGKAKKGNETPSLSGLSITSGTTGTEDGDEDERGVMDESKG